jgi:hypothetical protein
MANRIDYKIYRSVFSGDGGDQDFIGGTVSELQADTVLPRAIVIPAKGDGDRFMYRKYFVSVSNTNFSDGPVITNLIATDITDTGALILWDTDLESTSNVQYDEDSDDSYEYLDSQTGLVTEHSVQLSGLSDGQTYYYKVFSDDALGNRGSSDQRNFTTIDVTPPDFTKTEARLLPPDTAIINFDTTELTTGKVEFGRDDDYNEGTGAIHVFDVSHRLSFLEMETGQWYFEITIVDQVGLEATSGDIGLFIPGEDDADGPVISNITPIDTGAFSFRAGWNTDVDADTKIVWGPSTNNYTDSKEDLTLTKTHDMTIQGLQDETAYFWRPVSRDGAGVATSGSEGRFSTYDGTPPSFTGINVSTGETGATIDFYTTESASGEVSYSDTVSVFPYDAILTPDDFAVNFAAEFTGLDPATKYYVRFRFEDDSTNTGEISNYTFTTSGFVDLDPPVISNIDVTPFVSGAIVNWDTDELATSVVYYDKEEGLRNLSGVSGGFHINHEVQLTGLSGATLYYFSVESQDIVGNLSGSATGAFQTLTGGDEEGMAVFNVNSINITDVSATIIWDTNKLGTSAVFYGVGAWNENSESVAGGFINHDVPLTNLSASTTYKYKVFSRNVNDSTDFAFSEEFTFTTEDSAGQSDLNDGDTIGFIEVIRPQGTFPDDGAGGLQQMPLHCVIPLVNENDLNINWAIDGNVVQKEIVKRKADGTVTHAELIVMVGLPQASQPGDIITYTLLATTDPTPGPFTAPALDQVIMHLREPNGALVDNHQADIVAANNVRTYKDGHVCQTYKYYNRLLDKNGRKTLGCHTYITFYKDYAIIPVHLNIDNAHIDPTKPNAADGEHGFPYDVTGMIFFDELYINSQSQLQRIEQRHVRYCGSDVSNQRQYFVQYAGAGDNSNRSIQGVRSEVWPCGYCRSEHFMIIGRDEGAYVTAGREILDYQNFGTLISGRNDGVDNRLWGPGLFRVGRFTDDYESTQGTHFGRATANYKYGLGASALKEMLANNTTVTTSEGYIEENNPVCPFMGCWHPVGMPSKGSQGGHVLLGPFDGMDPVAENLRHWTYWGDCARERHHYQMYDNAGNVIGAEDWRQTHGGIIPFFVLATTGTSSRKIEPFFGDLQESNRDWIAEAKWRYNGGTCTYIGPADASQFWDSFTPIDDAHIQRLFRCYQGLIDTYNCPMSRELLRTQAEYYLMSNDRDTDFETLYGEPYEGSLKEKIQALGTDGTRWYKGIDYNRHWGRGKAWAHYTMALFYIYALEQTGQHAAKIHSEDLIVQTGQRWRAAVYPHFIAYHDMMTKAMPGGPGFTTPTHRRLMGASTAMGASAFGSSNEDIGSAKYVIRFTTPFNDANPLQNIITGQTSGHTGELTVFRQLTATVGEILVYDEKNGVSYANGETIIGSQGGVGVISDPANRQYFPDYHGMAQFMEMNINQLSLYSVATAIFDGVDNTKRNDLYIYVYEYTKAQVEQSDWISILIDLGGTLVGGYHTGLFASSNMQVIGSDNFWEQTLYSSYTILPKEAPWRREAFPFVAMFFTWWPHVCGLYAGEALGVETLDVDHTFLADNRKIHVDPLSNDYDTKIANVFFKAGTSNNTNAWDVTAYWPIWIGEVRYQQSQGPEPAPDGGPGEGTHVKNLKIGLRLKRGSGRVYIANTNKFESAIDAIYGTTDGDQTVIQWYESVEIDASDQSTDDDDLPPSSNPAGADDDEIALGDEGSFSEFAGETIPRPLFKKPLGEQNFVTLYGEDNKLGGLIKIEDSNVHTVPFWVYIELEQNEDAEDIVMDFGADAEEA